MMMPFLSGCGDPDKDPIQHSIAGVLFGEPNPKGIAYQACQMQAEIRGMTCEQLREMLRSDPYVSGDNLGRGEVPVSGYYRANGTYVQPYTRTAPDGIKSNNRSGR
jgi:hypothetical protein